MLRKKSESFFYLKKLNINYRFTSIIPCNIFGPHDNYNLKSAHVIPALIHKIYIAKAESQPLIVFGTGAPLRQFIFSNDLAKLIIWAIHYYEVFYLFMI